LKRGYIFNVAVSRFQLLEMFPSALDDLRLELTKRGREWVDGQEPIPELPAEYLTALQRMVPNLDEVVREYVVEGLGSFEHDRFRAAAVMIGAASENASALSRSYHTSPA